MEMNKVSATCGTRMVNSGQLLDSVQKYGVLYLPSKLSGEITLNAALMEPIGIQIDSETVELEQARKAMLKMRADYQCQTACRTQSRGGDGRDLFSACQIQAPASAEWLKGQYEEHDGISLPRSVVYSHYLDFCVRYNFEPANPAGFGKMIRMVFPRIKTRRLGNRGNSKYHYYGIKVKDQSPYSDILSLTQRVNSLNTLATVASHSRTVSQVDADGVGGSDIHLGHTSIIIPGFPSVQGVHCPAEMVDVVAVVLQLYKSFCQRLLECLVRADFKQVHSMLLNFWKSVPPHIANSMKHKYTCELIALCDSVLYSVVENVLVPSIVQTLPVLLLQDIQVFCKNLVKWTCEAIGGQHPLLACGKMKVVKSFCGILQKKAELNHEVTFSRTILHCYDSVILMRVDWLKLDFNAVVSQCTWTMGVQATRDSKRIVKYLQEFGNMLEQLVTMEKYFVWIRSLVDRFVKKVASKSTFCFSRIGQDFMLKWNLTAHCILKELYLEGAVSYGSFHLVHQTLRDYMTLQVQKHEYELNEMKLHQSVCSGQPFISYSRDETNFHLSPMVSCPLSSYLASQDESLHTSTSHGAEVEEQNSWYPSDHHPMCFHGNSVGWPDHGYSIVSPVIKEEFKDAGVTNTHPDNCGHGTYSEGC